VSNTKSVVVSSVNILQGHEMTHVTAQYQYQIKQNCMH